MAHIAFLKRLSQTRESVVLNTSVLVNSMQGAPEVVAGACKVMYKDVQSVRLDSKLLQAAHPDIYAECSKKTVYKRFSVV